MNNGDGEDGDGGDEGGGEEEGEEVDGEGGDEGVSQEGEGDQNTSPINYYDDLIKTIDDESENWTNQNYPEGFGLTNHTDKLDTIKSKIESDTSITEESYNDYLEAIDKIRVEYRTAVLEARASDSRLPYDVQSTLNGILAQVNAADGHEAKREVLDNNDTLVYFLYNKWTSIDDLTPQDDDADEIKTIKNNAIEELNNIADDSSDPSAANEQVDNIVSKAWEDINNVQGSENGGDEDDLEEQANTALQLWNDLKQDADDAQDGSDRKTLASKYADELEKILSDEERDIRDVLTDFENKYTEYSVERTTLDYKEYLTDDYTSTDTKSLVQKVLDELNAESDYDNKNDILNNYSAQIEVLVQVDYYNNDVLKRTYISEETKAAINQLLAAVSPEIAKAENAKDYQAVLETLIDKRDELNLDALIVADDQLANAYDFLAMLQKNVNDEECLPAYRTLSKECAEQLETILNNDALTADDKIEAFNSLQTNFTIDSYLLNFQYYIDENLSEKIVKLAQEAIDKINATEDLDEMDRISEDYNDQINVLREIIYRTPDVDIASDAVVDVPSDGNVVNITEAISGNALDATVTIPQDAITLTKAEQEIGVWVWTQVTEVSAEEANAADVKLIADKVDGSTTVASYLNIVLFKQVPGEEKSTVSETNQPLTITITVPENLRSDTRTFSLVYTHNGGAAQTITPTSYDAKTGALTFQASQFSTYALVYTEVKEEQPVVDNDKKDDVVDDTSKKDETTVDTSKKDETTVDTSKKDETVVDTSKKDETTVDTSKKDETTMTKDTTKDTTDSKTVKTGDSSQLTVYVSLMVLALAGVAVLLAVNKPKKGRREL